MNSANHPLWGFLRFLVHMCAATVVLYITAEHFDGTELKSIAGLAVVALVGKGGDKILANIKGGGDGNSN